MSERDCVVFTGGGTGGHVFPGLAVIEELKKAGLQHFVWIGSASGMEKGIVEQAHIPFYGIPSGKLRRYFSLRNFFDVFKILIGFFASIILLIKLRPGLLFSKGGYVTVPPVAAAALLGIPVITHESDSDPGIATKINALFARKILTSFKETASFFPPDIENKVMHTGNPVRSIFLTADPLKGKAFVGCPQDKKLILVLGGSLGAEKINNAILQMLDTLTADYFVVHQMGPKRFQKTDKTNYYPAPFFHNELADIQAASDLVICRAGSNTLWELAATGTPSILIPLPLTASRGDQLRNAELFKKQGAAEIVEEANLLNKLLEILSNLINNNEKMAAMRKKLQELSIKNAAWKIAEIILEEYRR